MKTKQFGASVVVLDSDKRVSVTSTEFNPGPEGEAIESEVSYNAKVILTRDDCGNPAYLILPHAKTGTHRYEPLHDTEYGTVTTTKQDIRVLLKFPRRAGFIAAARHLIAEASRIATFLLDFSIKHYGV